MIQLRTSRLLLCSLALALLSPDGVRADAPANDALGARPVTVFANGDEGYNIYRIPALVRAANGDLLAFCEAREGGDASEIDLVLKRSEDGGATWGSLQVVQESEDFRGYFEGRPAPPITVGNPTPVVDLLHPRHPGRVHLLFTLENDRVFYIYSDDHGATWQRRRDITADVKRPGWGWYATGPVHAVQLQRGGHRGRLVAPADHRLVNQNGKRVPSGAHLLLSDDHGQHWRLGAVDTTYRDGLNANETAVVELNDGRLYINSRDQNGDARGTRGEATSSDGGQSFSPLPDSPYKAIQPSSPLLDPPVVQCSMLAAAWRGKAGDATEVILFSGPDNNGPSGAGRSDLRLRYSLDGAQTWRDGPLLHVGPAAYSDLAKVDDSWFGVLYEAGCQGQRRYTRIDFQRFQLRQLQIDAGR